MDQNNNYQNTNTQREPLPTFQPEPQAPTAQPAYQQTPYQQPAYQQAPYQQPAYQQAPTAQPAYQQTPYQQTPYQQDNFYQAQQNPYAEQEVANYANSSFKKGLAALIMASFPVTSIISIFMGSGAIKRSKRASELASQYGVSAGGKSIAGKIMGIIGLIEGIFMTIWWPIYIILMALSEFNYYY